MIREHSEPAPPAPPTPPARPPFVARFLQAPVTLALFAVNIAVFVWASHYGDTRDSATLIRFGATWRTLVWHGEWWRLFTSMFLHIGVTHLFWNTVAGWSWCARAEQQFGHVRFLGLYLASGVAGAALSVIGHDAVAAGASGAMFGVIGARLATDVQAAGGVAPFLALPQSKQRLFWVVAWFMIGTYAHFDNYAHLGGLLFGLLFAAVIPLETPPGIVSLLKVALPLFLVVAASLKPVPVLHADAIASEDVEDAIRRNDLQAVVARTENTVKPGSDDRTLALRVWALMSLERYHDAEPAIDELAHRPRYEALAWRFRATSQLRTGHAEEALKSLQEALALEPANPEALAMRAGANAILGHEEAALADAELVETLGVPALYERTLVWIWMRLAAPDVALQHAKAAAQRFPDDEQLQIYSASALNEAGRDAAARAELDTFLQNHPNSTQARLMKAYFRAQDGETASALAQLEMARKADPRSSEVFAFEGWVHAHIGETAAAEAAFKAAQEIKPSASSNSGLAWAALQRRDLDQAEASSKQALSFDGSDPSAWLMTAEVAHARGHDAEAAAAFAKARHFGGTRWWDGKLASPALQSFGADGGR